LAELTSGGRTLDEIFTQHTARDVDGQAAPEVADGVGS